MIRLASTWHAERLAFSSRWTFRFTFSLFGCGGLEYETHPHFLGLLGPWSILYG
jgi:hypothetical protein